MSVVEIIEKIGLAIIGGVIVWVGTLIADRRKRKESQRDLLRRAYSQWFASESILARRIQALVHWVRETPSNKEQHDAILREVGSVEDEVKSVVVSLNDALLLETDESCRKMLVSLSEIIERSFETMRSMSIHHRTHLEQREKREHIRRELEGVTNEESRQLLQKQIDSITEWDEKCKFITPKSVQEIGGIPLETHQMVSKFRNDLINRSLI
jgi:hypothetical protein